MNADQYKENKYVKRWSLIKRAVDLLGGKCETCGETHIAVLSFHHTDPSNKNDNVSKMSYYSTNDWDRIEKEVMKCKLLCENCHRRLHFDQERFDKHYPEICNQARGVKTRKEIIIPKWQAMDTARLIELYNQNKSVREISLAMNREESTVRTRIKMQKLPKRKIKRKPRVVLSEETKDRIRFLDSLFTPVRDICEETNVCLRSVYKIIRGR